MFTYPNNNAKNIKILNHYKVSPTLEIIEKEDNWIIKIGETGKRDILVRSRRNGKYPNLKSLLRVSQVPFLMKEKFKEELSELVSQNI